MHAEEKRLRDTKRWPGSGTYSTRAWGQPFVRSTDLDRWACCANYQSMTDVELASCSEYSCIQDASVVCSN